MCINLVSFSISENFNSARQQLALAVEQTDLSTEEAAEEGRGKRSKRPPARYGQTSMEESIQDSSNEEEDASYVLASCPSFPNTTSKLLKFLYSQLLFY
jgi:hypothetical protein